MGLGVPIPAIKSNSWQVVFVHCCWILMDSVVYSPDRDTLHGGRVFQLQLKSNSWQVVFVHGVGFWRIEEGS